MSEEENKSLVPENIDLDMVKMTDLSKASMQKVKSYMQSGLPGIGIVDDLRLAKMMELYLAGKTYDQISNIAQVNRTIVMYLSYKLNWCETRKNYMVELSEHIKRRILDAKLTSQDFLLQLQQTYEKKIGSKINRYLVTENEEHIDKINLKELDRYLKIVELLQKTISEVPKDKGPLIGINLGDGATVTRSGDNQIEITPKQKAIGDVLKYYADLRREEENETKEVSNSKEVNQNHKE